MFLTNIEKCPKKPLIFYEKLEKENELYFYPLTRAVLLFIIIWLSYGRSMLPRILNYMGRGLTLRYTKDEKPPDKERTGYYHEKNISA